MYFFDDIPDHPVALSNCDRLQLEAAGQRAARLGIDAQHDADRRFVDEMIATHGYAITAVGTGICSVPGCATAHVDNEPWSYTVGRTCFGLPELVTTGLDGGGATRVTNAVGQLDPSQLEVGATLTVGRRRYRIDAVPDEWLFADESRMSGWFVDFAPFHQCAGRRPDVWQVVWADAAGRFPNDEGCEPDVARRQVLIAADPVSYPPIDIDMRRVI